MPGILTDLDGALGDHSAVNLVDDTILLDEIVGVGDDLVTRNKILRARCQYESM